MFPEVQDRILKEYHQVKDILGREPETADLHLYDYLDRAIKESLRILPLFGLTARVLNSNIQFGKFFTQN